MQFKSIASLAAFVAVAVAQDADLAVALPPNHWNAGVFCGPIIPVMIQRTSLDARHTRRVLNEQYRSPNTIVNVVVQDECLTCVEKQIQLTPAAFNALIGISPNNTIPVAYILPQWLIEWSELQSSQNCHVSGVGILKEESYSPIYFAYLKLAQPDQQILDKFDHKILFSKSKYRELQASEASVLSSTPLGHREHLNRFARETNFYARTGGRRWTT
ncbi:hypothetical protein B0H13DRAFT_1922639 [Mycena leptocephala]|nr:hypothetical protein B0H13DRAFT_1922639 [Mycena leptocephala]